MSVYARGGRILPCVFMNIKCPVRLWWRPVSICVVHKRLWLSLGVLVGKVSEGGVSDSFSVQIIKEW